MPKGAQKCPVAPEQRSCGGRKMVCKQALVAKTAQKQISMPFSPKKVQTKLVLANQAPQAQTRLKGVGKNGKGTVLTETSISYKIGNLSHKTLSNEIEIKLIKAPHLVKCEEKEKSL